LTEVLVSIDRTEEEIEEDNHDNAFFEPIPINKVDTDGSDDDQASF
jgi:hypothetical protein